MVTDYKLATGGKQPVPIAALGTKSGQGTSPAQTPNGLGSLTGGKPRTASDAIAKLLPACMGKRTNNIPGTEGGNKACAASVNIIAQKATGKPIVPGSAALSVEATKTALDNKTKQGKAVKVAVNNSPPGSIVTMGTGHIGISDGRRIVSNGSSTATFGGYNGKPDTFAHYGQLSAYYLTEPPQTVS